MNNQYSITIKTNNPTLVNYIAEATMMADRDADIAVHNEQKLLHALRLLTDLDEAKLLHDLKVAGVLDK